jgi:hypothetical protein
MKKSVIKVEHKGEAAIAQKMFANLLLRFTHVALVHTKAAEISEL